MLEPGKNNEYIYIFSRVFRELIIEEVILDIDLLHDGSQIRICWILGGGCFWLLLRHTSAGGKKASRTKWTSKSSKL